MYVCLSVCLSVCMYVFTFVCTFVCACVCVYVCMYVCMCVYMYVCVCMHVCMCVCMYISLCKLLLYLSICTPTYLTHPLIYLIHSSISMCLCTAVSSFVYLFACLLRCLCVVVRNLSLFSHTPLLFLFLFLKMVCHPLTNLIR